MSKKLSTFDIAMTLNILSKTKAKEFKALSTKKERDRTGLFIAEGEKCVSDTLGAFQLVNLICTQDWINRNLDTVRKFKEDILVADKRGMEIISSQASLPDVIAIFHKGTEDRDIPKLDPEKLYLLLDEVQDPGNLGTIIRTCDWFGVYDIFASKNTVDVYSPKVVQATMGSLSRVRVRYLDLKELIRNNMRLKLIGTVLDGDPLEKASLPNKGMLLMGNEGRGISEELRDLIDVGVTIPPYNSKEHPDSLNVAIATAIMLGRLRG